MPPDPRAILDALAEGPLAVGVFDGGALSLATGSFRHLTGLSDGAPRPDWIPAEARDGHPVTVGDRQLELWVRPEGAELVVALRDRSDVARLEDQLWEQQTRLSKAYSELAVRNQALTQALADLRQREQELEGQKRGLEEKVAEQLRQIEKSNVLKRYLSPEVVNTILSSDESVLSTRKRMLTIFFADLPGFDEISGEMESEEVIDLLSEYRREMTGILFACGGTLDKFSSARLMGFFGDPVPHEDHAERAVRAGLQMRDRAREMRRKWFPSGEVDLQVGIHTGYATVGNVGSEHRIDYTVVGKNVATASALQQECKPGQVLVSARTYEVVRAAFDADELQVVLKGSSRPVTAFAVQGRKTGAATLASDVVKTELFDHAEAAADVAVGRKLGPYVIEAKLGEGGMGVVYRATDERLERPVALKVLASELAADRKFVARFLREARALASLNSPHIAQIYSISEEEERPPYFAMELIEGPTLRRVLQDQGKLPMRRALDLATQMARGLQAAAEKGVIHRDIKPDNVMLTLKGQVKLTDFGLVKRGGEASATSRGIVLGTPLYMSPEQSRGEEVDLRSDIYALGATLFHMLTGEPPFRGESAIVVMRKHEETPLPAFSTLPGTVSASLYQVVQCMMAKRRDDRYASYEALIAAFDAC